MLPYNYYSMRICTSFDLELVFRLCRTSLHHKNGLVMTSSIKGLGELLSLDFSSPKKKKKSPLQFTLKLGKTNTRKSILNNQIKSQKVFNITLVHRMGV